MEEPRAEEAVVKPSEAEEAAGALQALLDDEQDDLAGLQTDVAVAEALSSGRDLRQYAEEVERALRGVERESINDYIKESESLAGLHTQIRECDSVLDTMESMLRGFQGDLSSISSQIKYLQDESLSMNVKLRNRKAAETRLSSFITQIVVPPELISSICDAEVDESYMPPPRSSCISPLCMYVSTTPSYSPQFIPRACLFSGGRVVPGARA